MTNHYTIILITIILPYKNSQVFFEECLNSILKQSYKNFELILVNDNSNDASESIAIKYRNIDNRISLFNNNGEGIIDALTTGSIHAKGKFITRMDSDDIMRNDKLKLMKETLSEKGPGYVCVGGVSYFASDKKLENGYIRYSRWINQLTYSGKNFEEIFKECTIPSPCWMIHHSDFIKINGFSKLDYPEDYDFAFRLWLNKIKICSVKQKIHYWRDHLNRTSRKSSTYKFENFIPLKIKYLLNSEVKKNENLVIWGAGKKGKKIVQLLIKKNTSFSWITENENKIDKNIYGIYIKGIELLNEKYKKIVVCCISDPSFKKPINNKMNRFISFY